MASTIWIDSDGFEWNKRCTLCGNYDRIGWDIQNNCRTNNRTNASFRNQYCKHYETPLSISGSGYQEPFNSYYNAGKPHDCPKFWCNDDD